MHRKCEISRNRVTAQGPCPVASRSTQEAQGRVKANHQVRRQHDVGAATSSQGCQKGGITAGEGSCGYCEGDEGELEEHGKIVQDALEVSWDMLSQMMALVDLVELVV